jgi:hypothetical protein
MGSTLPIAKDVTALFVLMLHVAHGTMAVALCSCEDARPAASTYTVLFEKNRVVFTELNLKGDIFVKTECTAFERKKMVLMDAEMQVSCLRLAP